ncbi:MAG: hypothetical protein A2X08_11020 [Bacteroidetes bacterium GWA2_32_17]|nr:MAG: hypothetical protein A2X08_11020 [Bacteroidetes bacterium GWA2_32_17]
MIISLLAIIQNVFSTKKDSLFFALKSEKNQNNIVDIYNKLSKEYKSLNPDSSLFYIKKAYNLSVKLKYVKGEADASYNYGTFYKRNSNIDSSLFWFENAFVKQSAYKDTIEISRALSAIGSIYSEKSDYTNAIKYFKKSLSFRKLTNDKKGIGIILFNIGNAYYSVKNYKIALENVTKAIDIFTEIDYKSGLASCLNFIGILYADWGNNDLALKSFTDALKIEENKVTQIDLYNNIGNVYVNLQNFDTAFSKYSKAYLLSKEDENLSKQAESLKNLGLVSIDMGNNVQSNQYLKNALLISEKIQSKELEASILSSFGYSLLFQQQCKNSLSYLLKSQEIANEYNLQDLTSKNYIFISEAYTCIGEGAKAKEYYKKHDEAQNQNNKELNDLSIKYETEKQDKEIQLLNKQKQLGEEQLKTKTAESKTQRIIIFAAFFFILIFIISIILIARQYRQKRKANELLASQNKQIVQQNEEITLQRDKLTEQKIEIEASINYALRIQRAVLPIENDSAEHMLGEYFLIFKPKYIVAGDFFWTTQITTMGHATLLIVAVADCTGHGVPGAFMSMLGVSFLNEIVRKSDVTQANQVLNHLRLYIIDTLKQKGISGEQKDGMDMSLCVINVKTLELQFAGANNPLYIIRNSNLKVLEQGNKLSEIQNLKVFDNIEEIKGDKMPVSIYEKMNDFTNHIVNLKTGDRIYMFSDGFADQFGGVKGKKFMYKPFKRLIAETSNLPIKEQGNHLEKVLSEWTEHKDINTGTSYEQTDDITVFGLELMNGKYIT